MSAITEKEQALVGAKRAADEASGRLEAVREGLAALTTGLAEVDGEIVRAIEAGSDPTALRARRSRTLAEREKLAEEQGVLSGLLERRKGEEKAALGALEAARREAFQGEANALGDEIRMLVAEIIEKVERVRLLETADDRSKNIARSCGVESPGGGLVHRAGLTWIWAKLQEIPAWRDRLDCRAKQVAG